MACSSLSFGQVCGTGFTSINNKKVVTALAFDPRDFSFSKQPFYELDGEEIVTKSGSAEKKFKPSAAAINPVSKDLYIISSVSKCIVVADRMGKIKNVVPLNPRMFKQPEGITFSNNGDLIVSNESAEVGAANILIFKVKVQR